jgi:hypothetical protein
MDTVSSSETSVHIYQTTQRNIPEVSHLKCGSVQSLLEAFYQCLWGYYFTWDCAIQVVLSQMAKYLEQGFPRQILHKKKLMGYEEYDTQGTVWASHAYMTLKDIRNFVHTTEFMFLKSFLSLTDGIYSMYKDSSVYVFLSLDTQTNSCFTYSFPVWLVINSSDSLSI